MSNRRATQAAMSESLARISIENDRVVLSESEGSLNQRLAQKLNEIRDAVKGTAAEQAFAWICNQVVFIPVPEDRKALEIFKLIGAWSVDLLDEERDDLAKICDDYSKEHRDDSETQIDGMVIQTLKAHAYAADNLARKIRARKGMGK